MDTTSNGEEAAKLATAPTSPFPVQWVTGKTHEDLRRDFLGQRHGFVHVSDKGFSFPAKFVTELEDVARFEPRADDVWIVGLPRSGNTWTQEMVWLVANDMDFQMARSVRLAERFPFFEFSCLFDEDLTRELVERNAGSPDRQEAVRRLAAPRYRTLADAPGRRFIQSHVPLSMLHKDLLSCGAKIIYLARNPKDQAVSYYHLHRLSRLEDYAGDFETYWNYYEQGLQPFMPYWSHVEEGWKVRSHPNVLFMFYEEICRDCPAAIRKVANLLGKQPTPGEIAKLADHLNIAHFRNNPAVNAEAMYDLGVYKTGEQTFIRKGQVGGWKDSFTPELEAQADKWIQKNLAKTDMRFPNWSS